ncbi:hypothetical protein BVI2075_200065 [Burkholderia vietnamiensis]|nr:hypothetical protein BVI2075_200065 [Burkholderia vietnamiensis]
MMASSLPATSSARKCVYLRAMLNELGRFGHWATDHPLTHVRAFQEQDAALPIWLRGRLGDDGCVRAR